MATAATSPYLRVTLALLPLLDANARGRLRETVLQASDLALRSREWVVIAAAKPEHGSVLTSTPGSTQRSGFMHSTHPQLAARLLRVVHARGRTLKVRTQAR